MSMSDPIEGSTRAVRHLHIIDALNGKQPANVERVFTKHEGTDMREALGAFVLTFKEWWASWFELTPRAHKILKRMMWVSLVVWVLIAPHAAGMFIGGYLIPAWVIRRVYVAYRAVKRARVRRREARVERRAGGGKKSHRIVIQWG